MLTSKQYGQFIREANRLESLCRGNELETPFVVLMRICRDYVEKDGSQGQVRRLKRQLSRARAEIQTQQRAFANLWQEHKLLEAERDSNREGRELYMRLYERQSGTIDNLLTAIERLTDKDGELQKRLADGCPETSTAQIKI